MLTFLPTPIGNLGDISFRALEVLKDGEYIFCEDTRVTKKLLQLIKDKYNQDFPEFQFISLHSHNESNFLNDEYKDIFKTKNCIYMSDAGMPCVSDPGSLVVEFCLNNDISFDVLPGANAILTAYASSGFESTTFTFYGFLPHKGQNRKEKFEEVMNSSTLAILYESPHRLMKLLEEINQFDPDREIFLAKELTKKYQKRYKGKAANILEEFKNIDIKGEWVVIVKEIEEKYKGTITLDDLMDLQLPPKQKAKIISKLTGQNTKEIYNNLISN